MKFIGIDLGWVSGASGLCCLQWKNERLYLLELTTRQPLEEILNWIELWASSSIAALIAVDAPTIIANATGMRLCDRLTHQYFGRYHAGCYPANFNRPFAQRTVEFGLSLEKRGFLHAPTIKPRHSGRYQIEVFPHPAMVHLFGLTRILKYKKGTLSQRRLELDKLRNYIGSVLPTGQPPLDLDKGLTSLLSFPLSQCQGTALKALEDQLDSLICAYIGAYWWYWGQQRNWVLGDLSTGYIIVPAPIEDETTQ